MSARNVTDLGPAQDAAPTLHLGDKFAWDSDRLVVTDEKHVAKLRRPALSPSTAAAMHECTARWAIERSLPWIDNPFGAAEIGTSAHSVLEELFDLPHPQRTEDAAMNILLAHSREQWPAQDEATFAKRGQWIVAVNNAYRGLFEIENPRTVAVRKTELKFEGIEVAGVPVIGYIDRVDQVGEKSRVVDYKTSNKIPTNITRYGDHHGDQLRIYAEAMRVQDGEMPDEVALYYTRHGKSRIVPISKPAMSKTLKAFAGSWEIHNRLMDSAAFTTKVTPLCGWCPAVNSCPVAAVADKVDRTGGAPQAVDLGIPVLRPYDAIEALVPDLANAPDPGEDFGSASVGDAVEITPDEPSDDFTIDAPDMPDAPLAPAALVPPVISREPAAPLAPGTTVVNERGEVVVVQQVADPAHSPIATTATDTQVPATTSGAHMSEYAFGEAKPWETYSNDGALNGNAYASTAVFGLSSLAYEELHRHNVDVKRETIDALTQTFAVVVLTSQRNLSGSTDYQSGLNTRLRGALRSVLDNYPLPFGKNTEEWARWVRRAISHTTSIANAAHRLHAWDGEGEPWKNLATDPAVAVVEDFIA